MSAVDFYGRPLGGTTKDEGSWNPQVGLKYRLLDWLTLKANAAKYVRPPSFFELFGDRGVFIGNADLISEKGTNLDSGFEASYRRPNSRLNNISLSAAYFHNSVDDMISRIYDARGVGQSVNISSSRIEGIETTAKIEVLNHLRFIGNATWQDPIQKNEIEAFDGKILPGRFKQAFLGRIEVFHGPTKVYGEYVVEKHMFYDTANLLEAEDKEEINLGASLKFCSFTLTLEAKNVGDDQYEDFNGYPMPGRTFYATLRYEF